MTERSGELDMRVFPGNNRCRVAVFYASISSAEDYNVLCGGALLHLWPFVRSIESMNDE